MNFFINKYIRKPPKLNRTEKEDVKQGGGGGGGRSNTEIMPSPCIREISEAFTHGCCPGPFFSGQTGTNNIRCSQVTSTRASRSSFVKMTTSALFPNTTFTNHEALPSLSDAFASFLGVYPFYHDTQQVERIRNEEYNHLSSHVCLDYVGINLFSYVQMHSSTASSSSGPSPSSSSQPPYFSISYKSVSLKSQVHSANQQEHNLSAEIQKRIMHLLNISDDEYSMVCTANMTTAFKLLAESYPFDSKKRLLSMYDHDNEAVNAMAESARKRGAKVMSGCFTWPSMRIHSERLTKKLTKQKKRRGLFVFPLQSRMTGARYPYLWMTVAQQNGWQVALDACALGPKDMDTFGLSLIQPDFIICSFFKLLGKDPSGFVGLLVKRSSVSVLASSIISKSIGIVTLVPERRMSRLNDDYSATEWDTHNSESRLENDDPDSTGSFSYAEPTKICNGSVDSEKTMVESTSKIKEDMQAKRLESGTDTSTKVQEGIEEVSSEIVHVETRYSVQIDKMDPTREIRNMEVECRGLDHADSLGQLLISSRLRCTSNWLVLALMKLKHPYSENGDSLVRVYGPRVKFDRGNALAFNVFDWKGEKVEPVLVQKLADRNNISLSCGFLENIIFTDKYEAEKDVILERKVPKETTVSGKQRKEIIDMGIHVISLSFNFLTNFEDAFRLWTFVAKFLDADFVEKERWRYVSLNQKMVEI